jgi:GNAT superfamily N-acetyltransferase
MEYSFKDLDALDSITPEVVDRYNELIFQLKGKRMNIPASALEEVKRRRDSELLLLMFNKTGEIAGITQVTFLCTPSKYAGYVNTVVVDEKYRGHGLGSTLLSEAEKRAKERWPNLQVIRLTSSPTRGTQGFYLRLGYRMRTKEAGDETIVYVKDIT